MTTTDIEEFLSKQKRFKCERLNAMLVQDHCDHNRQSGKIISCQGCPGLNKGDGKSMGKTIRGTPPVKKEKPVKDAADNGQEPKLVTEHVHTPEPNPPVTNHEIHIVNLIDVFKAKQAEELATFCDELSRLKEPYDKLKFAFEVCK